MATASTMLLKLIVSLGLFIVASCDVLGCVTKNFRNGSLVCVCNSTYCDTVQPTTAEQLNGGVVRHYVTTKAGKRLEPMTMKFSPSTTKEASEGKAATFTVNRKSRYQEMFGFGGAATDAATINTYSLSSGAAEKLIRSYFAEEGIGYSFIRVPMAGSDFSTHYYAYTDDYPNDTTLQHFNLTVEDYNYKIPFIKRAKELSPSKVKLFTASWSAPDWMKNINEATGASSLKEEYYQVYANYYAKFLDSYASEGLDFWGLTPQNEPNHGLTDGGFNSMGWQTQQMLDYLVANLCPTLKTSGYSGLKLMINDDLRDNVDKWLKLYMNDTIRECVAGMAIHWYLDTTTSSDILSKAHQQYPGKFMLYTEASTSSPQQLTGNNDGWSKGTQYITDLIQVTNNWVTGWVDWNMVLNLEGGPNWGNNMCDAPVIVNATADEFYKQPMFYAIAHFSKFVPPGSVHINLESEQNSGIENVAFLTPDNITVVVMQNKADEDIEAVIVDPDNGRVSLKIPANSMHTVLFK